MASKSGLSWTNKFYQGPGTKNVADSVVWKRQSVSLRNAQGETYFQMKDVKAPEFWSPLAIEIAASKYFRKRGVPKKFGNGSGSENSVQDMVTRVTESIEKWGQAEAYFKDKKSARAFRQDLEWLLYHQRGSFNSPVWFNAGLFQKYGITSKSRGYVYDFKIGKVVPVQEAYARPQISACFIQKIEDNLDSIFDLVRNEARIFKFGSGSGTNFSNLRSKYEQLAGGGTSSGVLSFLEVLDRSAGSVKSGGTTRRAAKMVILDIDHPEIEDFIQWKSREEQKAKALIQLGYDPHFEGEAYRTVSGQNSNNSVRVTDRFMKAVVTDQDWKLRDRVTGKTVKTVKAKMLWQKISQAAWECADPGLQFHDTVNRWHTCPQTGAINASNPCSEYMFLDDSACNLASLNLVKFLDADLNFKFEEFRAAARCFFMAQEILIDLASYPTAAIAQNSHDYRTLGLGFTGFGAFLMRQGIAYDSELARSWGALLTALLSGYAYELSSEVAGQKGAFAGWKKNKAAMKKVMQLHLKALKKISSKSVSADVLAEAERVWQSNVQASERKGFRNAQATVIAPTGTISFIMDSETTGIEPEYALVRYKSLAGGGVLKLTSPSVDWTLKRWGFGDEKRARVLDWIAQHGSGVDCPDLSTDQKEVFRTALEISPEAHIAMMAAVQPFVSGAISKTVNLPQSASAEDISQLYLSAWQQGLKAIAIYRDQSKGFQPLTSTAPKKQQSKTASGTADAKAGLLTEASSSADLKGSEKSSKTAFAGDISDSKSRWTAAVPAPASDLPACYECGTQTEFSGGCFRCPNCGTVIGCS